MNLHQTKSETPRYIGHSAFKYSPFYIYVFLIWKLGITLNSEWPMIPNGESLVFEPLFEELPRWL